jgi:arylsulfatase A-like enzyme
VPFIVSWPGHTPKGKVDRRHLVGSTIDLFPTLCDYAQIPAPAGLPGRSVRPIVEQGSASSWRKDLVVECGDSRTLRSEHFKYSIWEGPGTTEVLFDMRKDGGEMKNLATVKSHSAIVAEHRRRLQQQISQRLDAYGQTLFSAS